MNAPVPAVPAIPPEGAALLAAGRFHEALAIFRQALDTDPGSIELRMALAQGCVGAGEPTTAAAWLSDALRVAPGATAPLQALADLLLARKNFVQARPLYEQLCAIPELRNRANLLHAGYSAEQVMDLDTAAARYREAIALDPDFLEAHVDLAGILWRMEDFEGALRHAQRGYAVGPAHAYAVRMMGTALLNLNRIEEAIPYMRRALELLPGFPLAQLDLAFALLTLGDYANGWREYEHRWRDTDRVRRPPFWQPHAEWPGPRQQTLAGQTIAVYAEQGLGDVLQFIRLVPLLQAQGAEVWCVLQAELASLVETSFPGVRCLGAQEQLAVRWHVALLELPLRLGITLDNLPTQVPYLQPSAAHRALWEERIQPWQSKFRIGIAWSGSWIQVNNLNRMMPLSRFAPIVERDDVQCFSLQKGDAGPATDTSFPIERLVDLTGEWRDFSDSAAMFELLDLVITVDTAVAHLAGALGKQVWVILPPNADWRWLLERDDSPWYPTMRLFRRDFGEPREAQMGRVVAALEELLAAQRAGTP